ncbi:hypothetical protein G7K_1679-t1 [Saitoella complicata NRRL Y-17804]|uniref:Uncharacterized protein n=1 Tax=Saitoella complicata (strain BCRC 22490 / CBS 7301 / JCM 7358 / NBRC 10748 / NRRL Y-17804) TaxID=698492 RepID=A0A0E9NC84_SAICN|nr:hypothetical protein G7K_1679-t1 [Saitoella complicata NRRL Y-17804]
MSPISNAPKFRLPKLKVKPARPEIRKPCAVEMASLLSCWASSGGPDAEMSTGANDDDHQLPSGASIKVSLNACVRSMGVGAAEIEGVVEILLLFGFIGVMFWKALCRSCCRGCFIHCIII